MRSYARYSRCRVCRALLVCQGVEHCLNAKHASMQISVILDTRPSMLNTMATVRVYNNFLSRAAS